MKRNYIFDTIKSVYRLYGYQPLETPAMETLDTLLGKYGEEGDKLLFKVLNSGDFLSKTDRSALHNADAGELAVKIAEKGLRYDLTVPFARYVVQHRNEVAFPFKRYQIQPVWRADRPQKGRYREFYQCDADVIGSDALINETELVQIIDDVFRKLRVAVNIHINNRKILFGIAEYIGYPGKLTDITTAIDKMDKTSLEEVVEELRRKGIDDEATGKLTPVLQLQGANEEKLTQLKKILAASETGLEGYKEVTYILEKLKILRPAAEVVFDLTLARGLDYYTGAIFEVKAKHTPMGSICGGGRYDDLTGVFGLREVSGVGISFGADRIFDVMTSEDLFPKEVATTTKVMFVNFGEKEQDYCLPMLQRLREEGIASEIFPAQAKIKKQMTYANKKGIPYVIMAGESEMEQQVFTLKEMETGNQETLSATELIGKLQS